MWEWIYIILVYFACTRYGWRRRRRRWRCWLLLFNVDVKSIKMRERYGSDVMRYAKEIKFDRARTHFCKCRHTLPKPFNDWIISFIFIICSPFFSSNETTGKIDFDASKWRNEWENGSCQSNICNSPWIHSFHSIFSCICFIAKIA